MKEYLAFSLKYRPKNFDEVVGQEHIVGALKDVLKTKRLHHAYLFSGPRGIGKTSLARIFAKALNCQKEKEPTSTPCGECYNCKEIASGSSLDVLEIDGASNRGIDEIRTLRENVKLFPASSRYKIYIIDEVHQITHDAFNALLKTLEEPPSHVKFIFATTHPQRIIPTILSRCQKFQFHLIPVEKIIQKLRMIVQKENLPVQESLLYAIAHSSGGSIRDAESLLDQFAPILLEKGKVEEFFSFLGIVDEASLNKMVELIVSHRTTESIEFIDSLVKEGKDLGVFLNGLIEHLRALLLAKVSPKSFKKIIEVSPSSKDFLARTGELLSLPELLRTIDLLIEVKDISKKLDSIRIPLELAIIKVIHKDEISSSFSKEMETPLQRESNSFPQENFSENSLGSLVREEEDFPLDDDFDLDPSEKEENLLEDKESFKDSSELFEEIKNKWNSFLKDLSQEKVSLSSYLSEGYIHSLEGRVLKIAFPKKYSFHKEILERSHNTNFIQEFLAKYIGIPVRIKFFLSYQETQKEKESTSDEEPEKKEISKEENHFLNELLDTFGGKIHTDE